MPVPTAPFAFAPAAQDPLDRVAKLGDLRERGLITDAEFEVQKRKLLGE
jgi:hypothetical protein